MFLMKVYNYKQQVRCHLAMIYIKSTQTEIAKKTPAGTYLRARSNLFIVVHAE